MKHLIFEKQQNQLFCWRHENEILQVKPQIQKIIRDCYELFYASKINLRNKYFYGHITYSY